MGREVKNLLNSVISVNDSTYLPKTMNSPKQKVMYLVLVSLSKYKLTSTEFLTFIISEDRSSDAEISRSTCIDCHHFIRTGIKYEILLRILLFRLSLFSNS